MFNRVPLFHYKDGCGYSKIVHRPGMREANRKNSSIVLLEELIVLQLCWRKQTSYIKKKNDGTGKDSTELNIQQS